MDFTIREARESDACDIASVHVRSWRETYAGIISNEYLCGLSIEGRSKVWRSILSGDNPKQHTYVAEVEGAIVGFCNGGIRGTQKTIEIGGKELVEDLYYWQGT